MNGGPDRDACRPAHRPGADAQGGQPGIAERAEQLRQANEAAARLSFLPNAELERRGIMHRKGFPESFDQARLLQFVADVKAGKSNVEAPVYSHFSYDIVPNEKIVVDLPDILIVEGLNVLQPAKLPRHGDAVPSFRTFSISRSISMPNQPLSKSGM